VDAVDASYPKTMRDADLLAVAAAPLLVGSGGARGANDRTARTADRDGAAFVPARNVSWPIGQRKPGHDATFNWVAR
jgi:hypothetical protein